MSRAGQGPLQTITCAAGHPFQTTAAPGTHGLKCRALLEDGTRCRRKGSVPKSNESAASGQGVVRLPPRATVAPVRRERPARPPVTPARSGGVTPGLPPAPWRDSLGPECPGADTCGEYGCDCSRPPIRYTGDHTGTVCPECGPVCWAPSPEARRRAQAHAASQERHAQRTRRATVAVPQHVIDAQGREVRRQRDHLTRQAERVLADQNITEDTRSDFAWFRDELRQALTADRVGQLADQMAACPIERRGWLRRALGTADYIEPEELDGPDDDGIVDAELVDEDQAPPVTLAAVQRALAPLAAAASPAGGSSHLCEVCFNAGGTQRPAVARIASSVPAMIPERDVCLPHYQQAAEIVDRMTFASLEVTHRYGNARGVLSIVRSA